jgi:hypothetical protein
MNMIPQIAHHPRNISQQFGNPGFATPPFEPLHTPRRPDRLAPLPFRSSRGASVSALAPPQRAYPVDSHDGHRQGLARGNSGTPNFGGQYHDPSEHMLRRKTPNGTLAAGYDGTPVQWSSKAPALKHVVLPMSEISPSQNVTNPNTAPDDQRIRRTSGGSGWKYQQANHFKGFNAVDGDMRINSTPGSWTQLPSLLDPPQNVWDHIRTQQVSTFYPNNGMQIPTVLQPAYQPSPGPTASNDGGLYGPYWPDGRFVPYRPAAIRDHAYHHSVNQGFDLNRVLQQQSHPPTELLPPFRPSSFNVDLDQSSAGNGFFSVQDNVHHLSRDLYLTSPQVHSSHAGAGVYLSFSDGSRTPTAQSVSRASNPRFKEKTLSWAHSIYVDLLAFLHQSKKESRSSRNSQGVRTHSKNNIYPKPPRQPAAYLGTGSSHWAGSDADGSNGGTSSQKENGPTPITSTSNNFNGWQGTPISAESRHARPSHQDMPHYVSPFQTPQMPDSPLSKAKEALEVLTSLCDQSGWGWIDGMLLGGCLAYGLEEYHKALDWYSKIVAFDPK